MTRTLTVALVLGVFGQVSHAQSFGRFGYDPVPSIPGFILDKEGFAAKNPSADKVRFPYPSALWKRAQTSDTAETILIDGGQGGPSKVRVNLCAPGFELYFPKGLVLKIDSPAAPYLSWKEGSVSAGVPTPDEKWSVISLRDSQPPLVLGILGGMASLQITGSPGSWLLRGPAGFKGWVRVGLPLGLRGDAANTASSLGKLAKAASQDESAWTEPSPNLTGLSVKADELAVDAEWKFDRAGAIIPTAAILAQLVDYPIRIESKHHPLQASTDEGPIEVLDEDTLRVHFPVRHVPFFRAAGIGVPALDPISTVSVFDLRGVIELAFENMLATRDNVTAKTAEDTLAEYLLQANYAPEPFSGQQLPFQPDGTGLDLAAAQALLMQSGSTASGSNESNSLLASLLLRRDWPTWSLWCTDDATRRRGNALAAIAGAMSPDPARRLDAAMYQTALSGERGLQLWLRRSGVVPKAPAIAEPLLGIRQALFALQGPPVEGRLFGDLLLSPMRVSGNCSLTLTATQTGLEAAWPCVEAKASTLDLTYPGLLTLSPVANLRRLTSTQAASGLSAVFIPETAGVCQARITLPAPDKPLPKLVMPPPYSESAR